ncbi:MAG: hypothetical protein RLZZ365_692 [Pseudomonadota bacterium]|jgi:hypothetical protein
MIHQFQTKNATPVIMLDDLTHRIFNAIGRPFENQGIFLPEQIPAYIERLQAAIDAEQNDASSSSATDDDQSANPDPLGRRAYPFLELLHQALQDQEPVVWGV